MSRNIIIPEYYNKGIKGATKEQYLRKGAAKKLLSAAKYLQSIRGKNSKILVWDAFRPIEVQEILFNNFLEQLKGQNPEMTGKDLTEEAQRYVSIPSSDPKKPSPHSTGGAVDLTIQEGERELPMTASGFDDFSEYSRIDFYENAKTTKEKNFRDNRRLLFEVMIRAGFTNYLEEWWHFDFGNQFWGKILKKVAIYGSANLQMLQ